MIIPILTAVVAGLTVVGILAIQREKSTAKYGTKVEDAIRLTDPVVTLTLGRDVHVTVGATVIVAPFDLNGNPVNVFALKEAHTDSARPALKMMLPGSYRAIMGGKMQIMEPIPGNPESIITVS